MDERTHFFSVVASVLHQANDAQRREIQAMFENGTSVDAVRILKELRRIMGYNVMNNIITGLAQVENDARVNGV